MLFGASGYTGGRVAAAMVARGLRPVLMGRDDAKLAALAERLGGLDTTYADVADRTSLMEQIRADDVLVSTVGPFHKLLEKSVNQSSMGLMVFQKGRHRALTIF